MRDVYWLGKQEIANRQLLPLLELQEESGLTDMKFWKHRSERSQKDQRMLFGQLLKKQLIECIRSSRWYSILVDEVTDCSVLEQLLVYVGYIDGQGNPQFQFLEVKNVLEDSDSPNSATIARLILEELKNDGLNLEDLCGFGSDGASVMVGRVNGVGVKIQAESPKCLRTHCICHRLALACGDSNDEVKYITVVERTLVQLWKWLDYPKKTAAYVKVLASYRQLQLADKDAKTLATKISKACRTRWLSIGNSVVRVADNLVPLLLTLRKFKEEADATAIGLLSRMNTTKFVGAILMLKGVLPHLNELSKLFQQNNVMYASIAPSVEYIKTKLKEVRGSNSFVTELKENIQPSGRYHQLELELTPGTESVLTNLGRNYTLALESNIEARLGTSTPVLSAFSAFDVTAIPGTSDDSFKHHGEEDMRVLSKQFQLEENQLLAQWQNFKYLLKTPKWQPPAQVLSPDPKAMMKHRMSPTESWGRWHVNKAVLSTATTC